MRFKAVNDINSPDINTIYVGDEFFMFLEYKGSKCCLCISDLHIHQQSNDDGYSKPSLRRLNVTRSPYKKCNFALSLAMRVNIFDI